MTSLLRIPHLVDVSIIDRADLLFELDAKPQIGRELAGASTLLGKWLTGRLRERLRVGNSPLPTFVNRDAAGRQPVVDELERRLSAIDLDAPHLRGDIAGLASYVGGRERFEVGVVAQQVVGRCFDSGFRASARSYRDARIIADWAARPSPRSAWVRLTGLLDRARDRMWRLCRQDRMMLHGTILALPNLVDALERMRELFGRRSSLQVDEMLAQCLQGPARLLRVARMPVETTQGMSLRAGALLVYDLKAIRRWDAGVDVLMRGRWNQCPAHGLVPRLLATVWKRAQHDHRRPTGIHLVQRDTGEGPQLSEAARQELTPGNLETLTQAELDQLYARLSAGPMPEGPYQGRFFFPEGIGLRSFAEAIPELGRLAGVKLGWIARLGGLLWKGKSFFLGPGDEGIVRNIIESSEQIAPLLGVHPAALRHTQVDGREVALMFPARLFRGQSLADPRRESIIIDYDDGPQIEGYIPQIDFLAGRKGLRIRDEIRQIRPGLYLGRAYTDQRLLLMFTLHSTQAELHGAGAHAVGFAGKSNGGARSNTDVAFQA